MRDSFTKDPNAVEIFPVVWCDEDGTNDGSADDSGYLQGETISSAAAQMPSGITLDTENTDTVTIQGTVYAANTVHNIKLSGGTDQADYEIVSRVTTSTGRVEDKTITIHCREK